MLVDVTIKEAKTRQLEQARSEKCESCVRGGPDTTTLLYSSESLVRREYEKSRVRAVGMDILRSVCGGRRSVRTRNTVVELVKGAV